MDDTMEKECSALQALFMQVISDIKGSSVVWEDFINKTTKLHNALKGTLLATSGFLESFQKVADLATNTRGATREMGSTLTRLCLRHKAIENRVKSFCRLLMDQLVGPLQEKVEEWKKNVIILDKDHAKEHKKARGEIKRAASDTLRLQKKAKKGKGDIQGRLEAALADVNGRYASLEEVERNSARAAMIEQRSQFCYFVACLKPVMDEELALLTEVTHIQDLLENLCMMSSEPHSLPAASEQVILEVKGTLEPVPLKLPQTPPSSPSSIGSRKSSMCSINSLTSSASSDSTSKTSPGHHFRHRSTSNQFPPGVARISSISSQDSGFTSQDTLFLHPNALDVLRKSSLNESSSSSSSSGGSTGGVPGPFPSSSISPWANWPDPPAFPRQEGGVERPHTISAAFEKSHYSRPAINSQTFEVPDGKNGVSPYATPVVYAASAIPPVPGPRGRPVAPPIVPDYNKLMPNQILAIPTYVNQSDLAKLAAADRHADIPEEDETESEGDNETDDDVVTPTPKNSYRSLATHTAKEASGSLELAAALQELQASTAELELSTSNRLSLQCSSGYATMSSSGSAFDDALDLDRTLTNAEYVGPVSSTSWDGYATLPRSRGGVGRSMSMHRVPPPITAPRPVMNNTTGSAVLRRSTTSVGSKPPPPPPVRRTSSITGGVQVMFVDATPTELHSRTHRRSHSDGEPLDTATDTNVNKVEELPPPPPPDMMAHDIATANTTDQHSQVDGTLPQAPSSPIYAEPVLAQPNTGEQTKMQCTQEGSRSQEIEKPQDGSKLQDSPGDLMRHNSVVSSHAEIIQTLNMQFATRPNSITSAPAPPKGPVLVTPNKVSSPDTSPHKSPPPVAAKPSRLQRSLSGGESKVEGEEGAGHLPQIRRGVKLRRTVCNDRSAPKFK